LRTWHLVSKHVHVDIYVVSLVING